MSKLEFTDHFTGLHFRKNDNQRLVEAVAEGREQQRR